MHNGRGSLWHAACVSGLSLILAGAYGCGVRRTLTPTEMSARLEKGFLKSHPRLFLDWPALVRLVRGLGYDPEEFHYRVSHNAAGTQLYVWNSDRDRVLILAHDGPPRVVSTPRNAVLDEGGNVIAWKSWTHDDPGDHVHTAGGGELRTGRAVFDYSGRYLATCRMDDGKESIEIYSVPLRHLATSKMKEYPGAIFVRQDRLYLLGSVRPFGCEVYRIEPGRLTLEATSEISCWSWRGWRVRIEDVDASTGDIWIVAEHDPPTLGAKHYVYNVCTGKMHRIGWLRESVGFLSHNVFDGAISALRTKSAGVPQTSMSKSLSTR